MQRDLKIRGYTVAQAPNPPLWAALAAAAVGAVADEGTTLDHGARAVFFVAITVWAWEEAAHGVNGFRRALGAVALVLIALAIGRELS